MASLENIVVNQIEENEQEVDMSESQCYKTASKSENVSITESSSVSNYS